MYCTKFKMKTLLILILSFMYAKCAAGQCASNQFDCRNEICVDQQLVCDGRDDCGNMLDELQPECDAGEWTTWNSHDYLFSSLTTTKVNAKRYCKWGTLGTNVTSVLSPSEQNFLRSGIISYGMHQQYLIGLERISEDDCNLAPEICGDPSRWQWDDESPVSWTSWNSRSPSQPNNRGACVTLSTNNNGVVAWTSEECEHRQNPVICKFKDNGVWREWNNHDYYFSASDQRRDNAAEMCNQKGGELTSVLSQEENEFLAQHVPISAGLMIGFLRPISLGQMWRWFDKNRVSFTQWAENEPRRSGGDVVLLNHDGHWTTGQNNDQYAYICKRGPVLWTRFNYDEYLLSNFTTLWKKARAFCLSHGAQLASVLTQAEHDFLASQIQSAWIGLKIGESNWLDGHPLEYLQRELASPGSSGNCAMLYVSDDGSGSGWSYKACDLHRNFVCKRKLCDRNEFRCDHGQCVNSFWVCDGKDNCGDGSDERHCTKPCGEDNQFQCDNGLCIDSSLRCDGWDHCGDGSDETLTDCTGSCEEDEFQCDNGRCVHLSLLCDSDSNCGDLSDERGCTSFPCRSELFQCTDNTKCISAVKKCDGENNCDDGSDEASCEERVGPCDENDFTCDDGTCIHARYLCDGSIHCQDGSDEKTDTCKCAPDKYGSGCTKLCGFCRGNAACYKDSGRCPGDMCEDGFEGEQCFTDVDGWPVWDSKEYKISSFVASRDTARDFCHFYGGELVSVITAEEYDFITSKASSGAHYWIGLERTSGDDAWVWLDGSIHDISYWDSNSPTSGGGDCVRMYIPATSSESTWSNTQCHLTASRFICKRELTLSVDVSWCEQARISFMGLNTLNSTVTLSHYMLERQKEAGTFWYSTKIPLASIDELGRFTRRYSFLPGNMTYFFRVSQYGTMSGSNEVTVLKTSPTVNARVEACLL